MEDFDWSSTLHQDDVELLAAPFSQAMAQHTPFLVEARYKRADGIFRIMRTEANPRFDQDGRFLGMTGVNVDVTEQRDAEEQSRYLMGELNHRTKNLLAVVQAIARNTARSTDTGSFLDTFSSRLAGLAASNNLLVSRDWSAVSLGDLVGGQFDTIGLPRTAELPSMVRLSKYARNMRKPSGWHCMSWRPTASNTVHFPTPLVD